MLDAEPFFQYARERYRIMVRRAEGEPRPWTHDPVLQRYRFCNVFREDDKVTKFIRREVRERYANHPRLMQAVTIARWFNRPETIRLLQSRSPHIAAKDLLVDWCSKEARARLQDVHPLVTGAFMVKTPAKMNKLEGLIWCIEHLVGERSVKGSPVSLPVKQAELIDHGGTLKATTEWLCQFPYLGPFMAYEVVTDLRHTNVLRHATDIMTWANPGPGAARGASRVAVGRPDYYSLGNRHDRDAIQKLMQQLLKMSADPLLWPPQWPRWEMREVEHTLCEFDKYERARRGEGEPKQRYNGGA